MYLVISATVPDYEAMIEALDVKKAKRAGQYLDGCSVSMLCKKS